MPNQSTPAQHHPRRRAVMFVLNEMTADRRVMKEAASLVAAGWDVTVEATQGKTQVLPSTEYHPDGFIIRRHTVPPRPYWLPSQRTFGRVLSHLRLEWRRLQSRRNRRQGRFLRALDRRAVAIRRGLVLFGLLRDPRTPKAEGAANSADESGLGRLSRALGALARIPGALRHRLQRSVRYAPRRIGRFVRYAPRRIRRFVRYAPRRIRRFVRYAPRRIRRFVRYAPRRISRFVRYAPRRSRRFIHRAPRLLRRMGLRVRRLMRRAQRRLWRLALRTERRVQRLAHRAISRARRRRIVRLILLPFTVIRALATDLAASIDYLIGLVARLLRWTAAMAPRAPRLALRALLLLFLGTPYVLLDILSRGQLDWLVRIPWRWGAWAQAAATDAGRADLYHGHDLSAIGAAIIARRRHGGHLIYDSHEVYLEAGSNGKRPRWPRWLIARFAEGPFWQGADGVITVNREVAAELKRRYGKPRREILVHNCPPLWDPNPRPTELREAIGVGPETPVALYHGGLSAVRGLWQLMETIRDPRLAKAHLVFLGYGPLEEELREAAKSPVYGGRVHVISAVSPDVLDRWVAGADVGLMPNQPETLNEIVSTPNKLFESISAGVPVVTSDFPERRRITQEDPAGRLGAVCDPTDPADIARAIAELLDTTPAEREAQRQRCLTAARERWNWEHEAERLVGLYEELVPRDPSARVRRRSTPGIAEAIHSTAI